MAITDIFASSDNEDAALQYRRKLAASLLQQGMGQQQIIHPMQGIAQLGNALIGGLLMNSAASAEKDKERESDLGLASTLEKLYGGGGGGVGASRSFSEAAPSAGSGVASVRNNNPGAMYPGPSASAYGSTSHEDLSTGHKIAQFPDAESGGAAMFDLLDRGYKGMTLSDALNKWSGGNNAPEYTALVTGRTGLPANARLTRELLMSPQGIELAKAMAGHEAGGSFPMTDQQWRSSQGRSVGSGRPLGPIAAATPLEPGNMPPAADRPMPPPAQVASNDPSFIPGAMAYAAPTGGPSTPIPPPATPIPPGSSSAPTPSAAAPALAAPPPSPIQMAQAGPAPMSGADRQRNEIIRLLREGTPEQKKFARQIGAHLAVQAFTQDKPTDEEREYRLYSSQEQQAGRAPKSFFDYKTDLKRAGAVQNTVQIDQKGESAFKQEGSKLTAKKFADISDDAMTAKQMLSDIKTLDVLGQQIGTGKEAQVKAALGPYAEALGVKVEGLGEIQAFEAIVNRLAPNLRVKGSGAQSDFELRNFLKSLPSLGSTPRGNAIASKVMQGLYNNKLKAAEIADMVLSGEISSKDGNKMIRELPDPMEDWRKEFGSNAPSQTTPTGNTWSQ